MKKINLSLEIALRLFFSSFAGSLVAQTADTIQDRDSLTFHTLEEVVITANRYSSLRMNTPEAIKVLDSKSIQQFQLRTAPEGLLLTPGVYVQKTNHGGGSPFLRGLTGNQTLLLIDGIRLNNAIVRYGPNQYFNTIDIFNIERMEVLRGSGSVQYGSDAIGGTIHAFSYEPAATEELYWGSTLLTRIATHAMEQSINAVVDYGNKKAAFRAGLTWRKFGDIVGGDTTGRQSPNGYRELDYDFNGKILLSATATLTIALQSVHQSDVPVYHKIILENYAVNKIDPQKRKLAYIRLNKRLDAGLLKSAIFTASFQHSEEGRENRKNGSVILRSENDEVRTFAISAEAVASAGKIWSATGGLEAYSDLVNSRRTDTDLSNGVPVSKRGLYPDGATMTSIAAFTINTFDLPEWNFTAGARFNTFIIKVEDNVVGMTRLTPSAVVGNIAIMRKLNTTSNLFGSVSSGFRAPNIDDLGTLGIVDFRYETPNFDLKSEQSFQYQIGYKFQNSKLRGEFYVYRNRLNNLIVRNRMENDSIEGYPVYRKENNERANIHGAETAWDFSMNTSWTLHGSMTYTYGHNITKNEPVRRIPPLFGRFAVEYKHKDYGVNLEWQTAGKQNRLAAGDKDDNRIPENGTPGWNIFNVNAGYAMRLLKVNLSLQNLLNKDYRFHGSGVNGYGRSAFLTLVFSTGTAPGT